MQSERRGARPQLVERLNLPVQPAGLPQARVFQEINQPALDAEASEDDIVVYDNYGYGDGKSFDLLEFN